MEIPKNVHPTKTKSHEQTESLNRPVTSTEIESLIKNLPTNSTRKRWFQL